MAFWIYSGGYDMQSKINLDSLGQVYLAFTVTWTILLTLGTAFLVDNWRLLFLRVR